MAKGGEISLDNGKVMNNGKIEVAPEGKLKASENIINRGTIVVGVKGQIEEDESSIIGTGKVIFELGTCEDPETLEEKTSTNAEIVAAITSASATEVKLISDIDLSQNVEVKIDELDKVTKVNDLDLNGYTINSSVEENGYAITVDKNINLTIKNGSIVSDMTDGRNVHNKGTLTLNKVTMKGNYNVVSGIDGKEDTATTLTIIGGEYTAKFCGVYGSSKAKVTISGATITSDAYVVSGRGSEKDTTLVIKDNSVLTSKNDVAIYMPSTKLLQVVDSKVTGCSGIETAAGNVEITNSQVTATGISSVLTDIHDDGNKDGAGSVNDRSALLVMSRAGYGNNGSIKVTIKGSTLTSAVDRAIRTHVNGATENKAGDKIGVTTIDVTYDDATVLSGEVVNDKTVPASVTIKVNGVEVGKSAA